MSPTVDLVRFSSITKAVVVNGSIGGVDPKHEHIYLRRFWNSLEAAREPDGGEDQVVSPNSLGL